ncbi:MAG: hypothetical protein ACO1QB_05060 [Verrucomicrobiales bacterium]
MTRVSELLVERSSAKLILNWIYAANTNEDKRRLGRASPHRSGLAL